LNLNTERLKLSLVGVDLFTPVDLANTGGDGG
jgi:hypothetical protein